LLDCIALGGRALAALPSAGYAAIAASLRLA
jgi:hypothetical protein